LPVLHLVVGPNGAGKTTFSHSVLEPATHLPAKGRSFVAETVFSHPSKLDLIRRARERGYLVTLHVILVPEELSVVRVKLRAAQGGHSVPENKIRSRYRRLWPLIQDALRLTDDAQVYDNSRAARPYREVARYRDGAPDGKPAWPRWSPLK